MTRLRSGPILGLEHAAHTHNGGSAVNDPKVYQHDATLCTRAYDGLYCDGPCKTCDDYAANKADEADFNRREDEGLSGWLATLPW